jgi:hypothetical protein
VAGRPEDAAELGNGRAREVARGHLRGAEDQEHAGAPGHDLGTAGCVLLGPNGGRRLAGETRHGLAHLGGAQLGQALLLALGILLEVPDAVRNSALEVARVELDAGAGHYATATRW